MAAAVLRQTTFLMISGIMTCISGLRILTSENYHIQSLNDMGLDTRKTTSIKFQVVACSDVHVAVFDVISGFQYPRYEFVIGGWANGKSVVRQGDVIISFLNHTPLDCCSFNAFWVSWDGNLRAGSGFNVGENDFFDLLDTDMTVIKVGVTTGWGHTGVWAMSLDGSPLMPSDYDVNGYVECDRESVIYHIPRDPISSPVADPTSPLVVNPTLSHLMADVSSDVSCMPSMTCVTDVQTSQVQSTVLSDTTITTKQSIISVLETSLMSSYSRMVISDSSPMIPISIPMISDSSSVISDSTPVMPGDTWVTSLGLRTSESSLIKRDSSGMITDLTSESDSMTSFLEMRVNNSWLSSAPPVTETISPTNSGVLDATSSPEVTATKVTSTRTILRTSTPDYQSCLGCPCFWPPYGMINLSLSEKIDRIRESLTLVKYNLSAVRRRLTSAYDVRPSSRYMGASGATILALVTFLIVLADVQRVLEFLDMRKKRVPRTVMLTRTQSEGGAN